MIRFNGQMVEQENFICQKSYSDRHDLFAFNIFVYEQSTKSFNAKRE